MRGQFTALRLWWEGGEEGTGERRKDGGKRRSKGGKERGRGEGRRGCLTTFRTTLHATDFLTCFIVPIRPKFLSLARLPAYSLGLCPPRRAGDVRAVTPSIRFTHPSTLPHLLPSPTWRQATNLGPSVCHLDRPVSCPGTPGMAMTCGKPVSGTQSCRTSFPVTWSWCFEPHEFPSAWLSHVSGPASYHHVSSSWASSMWPNPHGFHLSDFS